MMGIALNATFKSFSFWSFPRNTALISLWKKVVWNPILFRLNKLKQHAEFFFTVYRHKKFNLGL